MTLEWQQEISRAARCVLPSENLHIMFIVMGFLLGVQVEQNARCVL
jgi:hypothetical protein